MDASIFELAFGHIKELHELCASDDLSLTALQQKISILDESDIQIISRVLYQEMRRYVEDDAYDIVYEEYQFLHRACMNKNVTLDIIKYLMETFPDPKGEWPAYDLCPNYETTGYPLHCACSNEDCPTSVIEYLTSELPASIEHLCVIRGGIYDTFTELYVKGLPLHYYLSRDKNVDFDTVKMLVEAYPQSLLTFDEEWPCYPIHLVMSNRHYINLEIIEYLLELEPSTIRFVDGNNCTLLNHACYNEHLTLEIYQLIFNKCPPAIWVRDEGGSLPIHALSITKTTDEAASIEILRSMLDINPTFAREIDSSMYRPIDWAAYIKSTDFCKVLIDAYPESLRNRPGLLPIHLACRINNVGTVQYMLDLYPESINARDRIWIIANTLCSQG